MREGLHKGLTAAGYPDAEACHDAHEGAQAQHIYEAPETPYPDSADD